MSRSGCLQGQDPAAAITTEAKVKVQPSPPPMRSSPQVVKIRVPDGVKVKGPVADKVKEALEFKVKVLPPTKLEVRIFTKIKVPVGVKARASATSTKVKVLLSPRSRFCCCLHY